PCRLAAVEALAELGGAESLARLRALASADRPYPIRAAAITGLAALDLPEAAALAATLLRQPTGPGRDPSEVFTGFLQLAGGPARGAEEGVPLCGRGPRRLALGSRLGGARARTRRHPAGRQRRDRSGTAAGRQGDAAIPRPGAVPGRRRPWRGGLPPSRPGLP